MVPCGTPAGTCRKSETPAVDILTRCCRFRKKSMIQFLTVDHPRTQALFCKENIILNSVLYI